MSEGSYLAFLGVVFDGITATTGLRERKRVGLRPLREVAQTRAALPFRAVVCFRGGDALYFIK